MDWGGWAVFGLVATTGLTTVMIVAQLGGRNSARPAAEPACTWVPRRGINVGGHQQGRLVIATEPRNGDSTQTSERPDPQHLHLPLVKFVDTTILDPHSM